MTEHTPTPWTLTPKPHASWIGSIGNNPHDPQLWSVATPFPKGDKRADAELIVKAVNNHDALVEALTDLIEAVRRDSDESGKGISGYTAARVSDARDVLALVGSSGERGK